MKKNIKIYLKIGILSVGILLLIILVGSHTSKKQVDEMVCSEEYVNRAEIPVALQFTDYEAEEWENMLADASDQITYGNLADILERLNLTEYVSYETQKSNKVLPRAVFNEVYAQIVSVLDTDQRTERREIVILACETVNGSVQITTQDGTYTTDLPEHFFQIQQQWNVCILDGQIIQLEAGTETVIMENTYIVSEEDSVFQVLFAGASYSFTYEGLEESVAGNVCDISWKNGTISKISKKEETIEGKLISNGETQIEIEGYGALEKKQVMPVYKVYGTVEEASQEDIVLGNMQVRYVVADGTVCAALLLKPAELKDIRVLLLNDSGDALWENIYITCDSDYTVTYQNQNYEKKAGELVNAAEFSMEDESGCLAFTAIDEDGKFYKNGTESAGTMGYDGQFEIRKFEGGYALVNALSLEEYLYGVVPSEMPVSYGEEALKVQAVCARSYACMQMKNTSYAMYGAHIDDSNQYQVYNQTDTTEEVVRAVDDTCQEVITFQGEVVETYYFSTSCGYTDTIAGWDIENDGSYDYLKIQSVFPDEESRNLSAEDAFKQYITDGSIQGYDSESRYYRWNVQADFSSVSDSVKHVITTRSEVNAEPFTYQDANGEETQWQEAVFGNLTGIAVKSRSESGMIRQLQISFENGTVLVKSEYNIRAIFGCATGTIQYQDGSTDEIDSLLPSAFFSLEENGTLCYQLYGGGNGHGIGMSQCAVGAMAKSGMTYEEIIAFFYQNVEIEKV